MLGVVPIPTETTKLYWPPMLHHRAITDRISGLPIAAAAALSFLKETKGLLTWTIKDVQKSLLISTAQAKDVIAALEIQGYVKQAENPHEWLTTISGEVVSGSKLPRFHSESVEKSLAALRERIQSVNRDAHSAFIITEAVAFGDFLSDRPLAQSADVGIAFTTRTTAWPTGKRSRSVVAKQLRARDPKLNLIPHASWMSGRSHRNLLVASSRAITVAPRR